MPPMAVERNFTLTSCFDRGPWADTILNFMLSTETNGGEWEEYINAYYIFVVLLSLLLLSQNLECHPANRISTYSNLQSGPLQLFTKIKSEGANPY